MNQRFHRPKKLIGYFLTPESSFKYAPDAVHIIFPMMSNFRLLGFAKSVIWILAAIGLALLLGQLN